MEFIVKQLQDRIQTLESNVTHLTKSLEFTQAEIVNLKSEVKELHKSDSDKQAAVELLQSTLNELNQRVNYQEDHSRRNNLRITGVREMPGETREQTATIVTKLLQDKLELPSVNLDRAHRVGPVTSSFPRTIVARFEKYHERKAAMRNAKNSKVLICT